MAGYSIENLDLLFHSLTVPFLHMLLRSGGELFIVNMEVQLMSSLLYVGLLLKAAQYLGYSL